MVDEAELRFPNCLCYSCHMRASIIMNKNWAISVDEGRLFFVQLSVHFA